MRGAGASMCSAIAISLRIQESRPWPFDFTVLAAVDISVNVFFYPFSRIFIPKDLRARGQGGYGQNIEPQGLTAKIFGSKDLAADLLTWSLLRKSVVENLLGEHSRIG